MRNPADRTIDSFEHPHAAFKADSEIGSFRHLSWLLRRWPVLVAAILLGAAGGALISLQSPPRYRAAATLRITPDTTNPAPLHPVIENLGAAEEIVREFRLTERVGGMSAATLLSDHVRIEDVWGRAMLRVHVTLPDPHLARTVSNALAERAVAAVRQLPQPSSAVVDSLKQQRDDGATAVASARNRIAATGRDIEAREIAELDRMLELEGHEAVVARAEWELRQPPRTSDQERFVTPRRAWLNAEIARRRQRMSVLQRELLELRHGERGDRTSVPARVRDEQRLLEVYEAAKQQHASLASQYETALLKYSAEQVRLTLVQPATAPQAPLSRQSVASAILGAMGGVVVGILLLSFVRHRWAVHPPREAVDA